MGAGVGAGAGRLEAWDDALVAGCPRTPRSGQLAVAAFLRVYEPLDVLRESLGHRRPGRRARTTSDDLSTVTGSDAVLVDGMELATRERAAALRAASALPPRVVGDLDLAGGGLDAATSPAALLLSPVAPDGVARLCPADLAWRALLAVEELRLATEPAVLRSFMSPTAIAEASSRLEASRRRGVVAPHVRSRAWHIPLPWFAAFRPEQRLVGARGLPEASSSAPPNVRADRDGADRDSDAVRPEHDAETARFEHDAETARFEHDAETARAGADQAATPGSRAARTLPTVRYLAPMADARRCVARALGVARRRRVDLLAAGELEELGRWLEEFHARSVVELDYGGLVGLIPDSELSGLAPGADFADDAAAASVALVAAAVAEMRAGEFDRAVRHLSVVRDRWAAIRAFERAS